MSIVKAVIYDCDGVIVNSDESILNYYSWLSEKSGVTMPDLSDPEFKRVILSYTEADIINVISQGNQVIKDKMYNVINNEVYNSGYNGIILEETLVGGLNILKEKGILMAVDTNRGYSLSSLLEHYNIREYFSYLITSRDVDNPKPHPDGVYKICDYFNIKPEETLFIGDSYTDYYAANESGSKFIAYKNKLENAPIIYDHREIINFLD